MDITDVRIRKIHREGKLRAMASITIDGVFVVHDIKVIEGDSGLFIAMPSRRTQEGDFKDIAHPISRLILEAYELSPDRINDSSDVTN